MDLSKPTVSAKEDDPTSEEAHQKLLSEIKIGETTQTGKRKLLSVIKELDPLVTGDTRAKWRVDVYLITKDCGYRAPELEYITWYEFMGACARAFPSNHPNKDRSMEIVNRGASDHIHSGGLPMHVVNSGNAGTKPKVPEPPHDPQWDLDAVRRIISELQLQPHAQPDPAATGQQTGASMATGESRPPVPPAPTKSGSGALLPALDEKSYEAPITTQAVFQRFARRSTLADALAQFDARVRVLMNTPNSIQGLAKHISNSLATHTQLAGWRHVQEYVVDPTDYKQSKVDEENLTAAPPKPGPPRAIDQLHTNGQQLTKRLVQRVDWVLQLLTRNKQEFDADFCVQVVAADTRWMEDTSTFIIDSERKVTEMLGQNPQRFAAFRDLQRRGVQWPHTPQLRKEIEATGFVFRPMMIKRDRCVCETCGAEVTGWRPWHNPWLMHNMTKHDATFQEKAQRLGAVYAQSGNQQSVAPAAVVTGTPPPPTT